MERLKLMKEKLLDAVECQISDCLENVSAEELGEAVDMIKDLDEAIYYCTATKAMEEKINPYKDTYYYTQKMRPIERYELPYNTDGYAPMYYSDGRTSGGRSGSSYYHEDPRMSGYNNPPMYLQDGSMKEGKSALRRKMYMEGKQIHRDKGKQIQELEAYVQDLGSDITEMIQDASPEEKQLLQQKISGLASKIK